VVRRRCQRRKRIGRHREGTRPTGARHSPVQRGDFFGVALIGHPRIGHYYFPLGKVDDREAVANLSQARLFDTKRLIRKIGTVDERTFRELAKALALTLFPFLP
jgi:hypothetical protein